MAEDIAQWLDRLGLGQYAPAFAESRIDLDVVPRLTEDDLKDLGLPIGDRRRLQSAIEALSAEETSAGPVTLPGASSEPLAAEAERRQLTVMFCDLVGSTALSRQLDPEDLRDVMRRYQDAVAGAVTRYGGHVAKYLGDGVLAYFGWPQAYEDQAERAVRAGLDAVSAVNAVEAGKDITLEARVGIASGHVVVGDLVRESGRDTEAVSGETPNLAARLQDVAEPGQAIIENMTRQLVGTIFELNSLGSHELKGFQAPVAVWSVTGEGTAESRFEAAQLDAPTQLIGREHELGLLRERWDLAKHGEGQVVLLSGEAGIGKSRMVQALRDQIADEHYFRLRYQCTPHHTNSAFYPIVRRLERAAGFTSDDDTESKLDKLERLLRLSEREIEPIAPVFANFLSVPGEERYGPLDLTPQQLRAQTISVLIEQVLALSKVRPVLYVMEDAHWIDPTTETLVAETISRLQNAAVLIVITHRPGYAAPFLDHPHLTSVMLNRLSRAQGVEMVRELAGDSLADTAIEHLGEHADGVPLFIEELTKTVLEANAAVDGATGELAIPATLHASLVARLDRLGGAKRIAQVGAVIGREFSYQLIAAMAPVEPAALHDELRILVDSGLVFQRGAAPAITYSFKHALIRDVAYEELLRNRRHLLHDQVARTLEADFPAVVEAEPELLAHHLTEAGQIADAVSYWHRAGRQSLHRSAYMEADAQLNRGISLLQELAESPERDRREVGLWLDIGAAQTAILGPTTPKVIEVYERARALSERIGEWQGNFTALWGLWLCNNIKSELANALDLSNELLRLATKIQETEYTLQANHAAWTTRFMRGDFVATAKHTDNGRSIYDRHAHASHASSYGGHDPGMCCNTFSAMTFWLLGFPDKSLNSVRAAADLAKEVNHPYSTCVTELLCAFVHQFRSERPAFESLINKCLARAKDSELPLFILFGTVMKRWAHIRRSEHGDEIGGMRQSIEDLRSGGVEIFRSYFLSLLAEACGLSDKPEEGLAAVVEALGVVQETGECWWQSELHRQEGKFRLLVDNNTEPAERCFATAIELAQRQSAKSLELRAATNLARLWHEQGKITQARDLLAPVHGWFTEGFDTPDLKDAKALLDELN